MSGPSPHVYKKSSGQDSLARKMLCALTSSGPATFGPGPQPNSSLTMRVSRTPGFNWLRHCCPQTQPDAISISAAFRIKPNPIYPALKARHTWLIPLSSWVPVRLVLQTRLAVSCPVPLYLLCPHPGMPAHPVPLPTEAASSSITSSKKLKCLLPATLSSRRAQHRHPRAAWSQRLPCCPSPSGL